MNYYPDKNKKYYWHGKDKKNLDVSNGTWGKNNPLPKIVIILFSVFAVMLLFSIVNRTGRNKKNNEENHRGYVTQKDSLPGYENKKAPALPEGKLGVIAKGVVYIESGTVDNNYFQPVRSGSGFIISDRGEILTNEHVVKDSYVLITFYNGKSEFATVKAKSEEYDFALLECNLPAGIKSLKLQPAEAGIGRNVYVLGFPLGSKLGSEITVTNGLISSVRRENSNQIEWYQINAAVNHGNSGGPLIDEATGEVLGIVTAKIEEAENIGLVRPINIVMQKLGR